MYILVRIIALLLYFASVWRAFKLYININGIVLLNNILIYRTNSIYRPGLVVTHSKTTVIYFSQNVCNVIFSIINSNAMNIIMHLNNFKIRVQTAYKNITIIHTTPVCTIQMWFLESSYRA